jgi:hypothetical protein
MQEKEMYTLRELYDNLEVPYAKLGKMADMSEGTVTRIRDGYPARRTTLNRLLRAFSTVYGRQLTLENVTGVQIEDKHKQEQVTVPPVSTPTINAIPQQTSPQKRTTERKGRGETSIPDNLPVGTVKLADFCVQCGVADSTFSRWIDKEKGIKKGDWIEVTTRDKASGMGKQHFLTPDQQEKAIEKMRRYGKLKS